MNELMNRVMAFRSKVGRIWKTPNTLDCLRGAAKSANELRDLWMRKNNPDHARHNERDDSMAQELADTVIMLLTAANMLSLRYDAGGSIVKSRVMDSLCFCVEFCTYNESMGTFGHNYGHHLSTALSCSDLIASGLALSLDGIVKARLKDIARRNGFDVGIVDEVWRVDEGAE